MSHQGTTRWDQTIPSPSNLRDTSNYLTRQWIEEEHQSQIPYPLNTWAQGRQ